MNEVLVSGPVTYVTPGRDVTSWRWFLQGQEVVVEITNTAMEADLDSLSDRVRQARLTQGMSEIERLLDWPVAPDRVTLATDDY